jgi:hypothetical protein
VANYGNGYQDVAYQRAGTGVRLRGAYSATGTLAAKARLFTLPAGMRPLKTSVYPCVGAAVAVLNTGVVQLVAQLKPGVLCTLDGVLLPLD